MEKPYIETVRSEIVRAYNPKFGDDRICGCGHPYYRHFDTYEKMAACGCKYCGCWEFIEAALSPEVVAVEHEDNKIRLYEVGEHIAGALIPTQYLTELNRYLGFLTDSLSVLPDDESLSEYVNRINNARDVLQQVNAAIAERHEKMRQKLDRKA